MANTGENEEEDEPRPAELRDVTVHEISLVDRPANKRPFLLFKSEDTPNRERGEDELATLSKEETEQLQEVLNTEAKDEEKLLEKVDGKSKNATKALLRVLQHIAADMEPEDLQKFLADAGFGFEKAEEKEPEDDSKTEEQKAIAKRDAALAALPENVREILKSDRDATEAENVELRKQVEEGAKWRTDFIEKADDEAVAKLVEKMQIPGMAEEDQVKFVKALPTELRETMKGWAEALKASKELGDPTATIGTARRGEHTVSAGDEIMKRAEALVKADTSGKLDIADAILKVRAEDPNLAEHSRRETLGIGG